MLEYVKKHLPTFIRRSNSALSIVNIFSLSPLAAVFGFNITFYENVSGLILFLIIGAIWYALELKYSRSVPNNPDEWQRFNKCLSQTRRNALNKVFQEKNPNADLSSGQYLSITLDAVLYFSVLLAFFRFILFVCGYDKLISPLILTIGFCIILGICIYLAYLNYQNSINIIRNRVNYIDNAFKEQQIRANINNYKTKNNKPLIGYCDGDEFTYMNEDEDFEDYTFNLPKPLYLFLWYTGSVVLALSLYFFVQWMMPFHKPLGQPYLLGLIASGVLLYLLIQLRTKYFGDLVRDCRPVIGFFVGVSTFDLVIDSVVLMVTGIPIQQQIMMPWLHTIKYVGMFFFACFLFLAETSDYQIPEYDIIKHSGRIKEISKSQITQSSDNNEGVASSNPEQPK